MDVFLRVRKLLSYPKPLVFHDIQPADAKPVLHGSAPCKKCEYMVGPNEVKFSKKRFGAVYCVACQKKVLKVLKWT